MTNVLSRELAPMCIKYPAMIGTLLTALAVVGGTAATVFILLAVSRRKQQRKDQGLKDGYRALLAQHNLVPDHEQFFPNRICALDTTKGVLVFVQHDNVHSVIELGDVLKCRRWKEGVQIRRSASSRNPESEEYVYSIGVSFFRRDGVVTTLPFYTEVIDGIASKIALSKATDHWLERLNKMIV